MPILKNAIKALKSQKKKNIFNNLVRAKMRGELKKFATKPTGDDLSQVYSIVDKAAKKKIIHKNKAARIKSKMQKLASKSKK